VAASALTLSAIIIRRARGAKGGLWLGRPFPPAAFGSVCECLSGGQKSGGGGTGALEGSRKTLEDEIGPRRKRQCSPALLAAVLFLCYAMLCFSVLFDAFLVLHRKSAHTWPPHTVAGGQSAVCLQCACSVLAVCAHFALH